MLAKGLEYARDFAERGEYWRALSWASAVGAGHAAGLAWHPNKTVSAVAKAMTPILITTSVGSGVKYHFKRTSYRESQRNIENIKRVLKTENKEWLRELDHDFVRKYHTNPRRVEKQLDVGPVGAAFHFISNRGLRKSPNELYSIRKHESKQFSDLVKQILQFKVSQLPGGVDPIPILERHYPGEGLKPISRSELPRDVVDRIHSRLLNAEPGNEREAAGLAVLSAAVLRGRMKDFKNAGRIAR